jgi:hypothetical protein
MDDTHAVSRAAVVDIGRFTIDCAVDDDGDFIDAESGSQESGVFTAQERISAAFEQRYGVKPTHQQIETMLRTGSLLIAGEPADFTEEVANALKPMIVATMSLMGRLWDKALDIHRIYITGGGAVFVANAIRSQYKQAVLVSNPQMSNAVGYRNYARFVLSDE